MMDRTELRFRTLGALQEMGQDYPLIWSSGTTCDPVCCLRPPDHAKRYMQQQEWAMNAIAPPDLLRSLRSVGYLSEVSGVLNAGADAWYQEMRNKDVWIGLTSAIERYATSMLSAKGVMPKLIICTGEPFERRDLLEGLYPNTLIRMVYSSRECGIIAAEEARGKWVAAPGVEIKSGTDGLLQISTEFAHPLVPIVDYEIGDEGIATDNKLLVLKGRRVPWLITPEGFPRSGLSLVQEMRKACGAALQRIAIQHSLSRQSVEVRYVGTGNLCLKLKRGAENAGFGACNFAAWRLASIPALPNGKAAPVLRKVE